MLSIEFTPTPIKNLRNILLLALLCSTQLLLGQGWANLKLFPPTCEDCCNGRIIIIDIEDCGVPKFSYHWELLDDQVLSADSVMGLCSGTTSFIVQDASNEVDTVNVLMNPFEEIHEEILGWDCFDSTYYNADIQFEAVMTHADTRDTLSGSEVLIYQGDKLFTRLITPVDDSFTTLLPLGHQYRLEFIRDGFFTKTLLIDSQGFNPWKVGQGYSVDTGISMIAIEEGLELDILSDPIGVMVYDPKSDSFQWDWEYTRRIKDAVDVRLQGFRAK